MKEISKLSEYFEYIEDLPNNFTISRGQAKRHCLLPSALRLDKDGNRIYGKRQIKYFLDEFKNRSIRYIKEHTDQFSELEWMAYAQHFGIPTKLLDFSHSHIVSLLFSVEKAFQSKNDDVVVWFIDPIALNSKNAELSKLINISQTMEFNSDGHEGPVVVQSRRLNDRINAQKGLFVYFNDNEQGLELLEDDSIVKKIIIKSESQKEILSSLHSTGIGFTHIYPELEYEVKDILMKQDINDYIKEKND